MIDRRITAIFFDRPKVTRPLDRHAAGRFQRRAAGEPVLWRCSDHDSLCDNLAPAADIDGCNPPVDIGGTSALLTPVRFQNSVERSCRFWVVTAEDWTESFASRDRA